MKYLDPGERSIWSVRMPVTGSMPKVLVSYTPVSKSSSLVPFPLCSQLA